MAHPQLAGLTVVAQYSDDKIYVWCGNGIWREAAKTPASDIRSLPPAEAKQLAERTAGKSNVLAAVVAPIYWDKSAKSEGYYLVNPLALFPKAATPVTAGAA